MSTASSPTAKDEEKTRTIGKAKPTSRSTSKFWDALPLWVSSNLRSKKSWKILARCWLTSWAAFVLILPQRSLTAIGNTAFFSLLVSAMVPPNIPVQLFLFVMSTLVVGMCLGWGIGAAAMRAALAARDQTLLKQTLLIAQQSAAGAVNPDAEFELEIFQGAFLDVRSSVVYGCFLAVAAFVFALIRAYAPKLALMSVFGTIVADIFCSYGPLFPFPEYTIVSSILVAVGCYVAIAVTAILLVFPETMHHAYLTTISAQLGALAGYVAAQDDMLALPGLGSSAHEGATADSDGVLARNVGTRAGIIAAQQTLPAKSGFLSAEFSFGRWSGQDARALEEPLRLVVVRICGLQSFVTLAKQCERIKGNTGQDDKASTDKDADGSAPPYAAPDASTDSDTDVDDATDLLRQLNESPQDPGLGQDGMAPITLPEILPVLRSCTAELRAACADALHATRAVVDDVNDNRWARTRGPAESAPATALGAAGARLVAAADAFKADGRCALLAPFLPLLRAHDARRRGQPPLRALIVASVYAAGLLASARAVLALLESVRETALRRRRRRLWAPHGPRALWDAVVRRDRGDGAGDAERMLGEDARPGVDDEEKREEDPFQRDPDSRPPTNVLQRSADRLHHMYLWFKTAEAIFAVKYVVVTIALWLPAVFPSSAYFNYTQKGVWALIMAQTTVNVYISDQLYNYAARLFGTFLGLVVGLLAWYIGNGRGNGNPFGSAASLAVFLVPVMFVRIFAPPSLLLPSLMFSVTLALIMGYSWIDGHLQVLGSPGIGWPVAWRRWVLVVIGCVASFIVMLFPPTSGRKAVRLRNAAIVTEISSIYASLLSLWIADAAVGPASEKEDLKAKVPAEFRERLISLALQVQGLRQQTAVAKWEGNIRGKWPAEEYNRLVEVESEMLAALAQLAAALAHLDPTWRSSLKNSTKILNPNFITDSMSIFALVSQSLRTGEAMHQVLPTALLERLLYHDSRSVPRSAASGELPGDYMERVQSLDFMYFATAVAAVSQVITGLDELHRVTKVLCGEIPFKGFNEWRGEFERSYQVV